MAAQRPVDAHPPRQPGRLGRALIRMLMKPARVAEVRRIAEDFHLITLESPSFKGNPWLPGHKLQVAMGSAFVARTFTPLEWDPLAGRTRLLAYAHGQGPGSDWAAHCAVGDTCDVFGPRPSLDTTRLPGPCVLVGDETSFGLACALARQAPDRGLRALFEVNALDRAHQVLRDLGLQRDGLAFERTQHDAHLDEFEATLSGAAADGAGFILTGKASSIQRLRHYLKTLGVPGTRIVAKAYWAPGKSGMD